MTAVLAITAVNAATDTLTSAAHGLNTGDGFLGIYTAAGTIPGGLAPVTDYWAIRVDANNVKLASSSTLAVAGTAIDITSAGSGTLVLQRGLPYRRPRIAAPGVQVFSADDNDAWAALVAQWNLLSGQAQTIYSGVTLAVPLVVNAALSANAGIAVPTAQNITLAGTATIKKGTRTRSFHPHQILAVGSASQAASYTQSLATAMRTDFVTSSSPVAAALAINGLDVGDRILNVRVYLKDVSGQSALTCKLYGGDRAGSSAVNAVTATSAASGATQTITLTAVNHTIGTTSVGPLNVYFATAINATGTYSIFAVEIDYDTP